MQLLVKTAEDADRHLLMVHAAAAKTRAWIAAHAGTPMELLKALKFESVGFHPIADQALNVIEQINQTFTYAVALAASKQLLRLHPDAGGYLLAPGAHMSQPLDIMSIRIGWVGAETFAAVHPANNRKLHKDLEKLESCQETHRYAFFASPAFPGTGRLPQFDRGEIQVWSVEV